MTERPFSPEEFVRLLSLPEAHPERVRAEASGMLEAWRVMLREFESPAAPVASPGELAAADAAIAERMELALRGPRAAVSPQRRSLVTGGWPRILAAFSGPAARPALALAMTVVVVSGIWWATSHPTLRAVRGSVEAGAVDLTTRAVPGGALELSWRPVADADRYRVRFFGGTLAEIARLDGIAGLTLRLQRDSLPPGLKSGAEVMVDVSALRAGDVIAVSNPRALRLP